MSNREPGTPHGRVEAPYGSWTSPLSAPMVAANTVRLGAIAIDGDDIYWLEGRPDEGGRQVIVRRRADGLMADATPVGTNVRTRVHEYGGGAYVVDAGTIYYSEFTDQRLYRLPPDGRPEPLTPPGAWFYADAAIDPARPRMICVREDHTREGQEPITTLVSVGLDGASDAGAIVASGYDFYAAPRFSPDGSRLSWLSWRHPQMPWDGTELWIAEVAADGSIVRPTLVAGGDEESIFQPDWSPDGTLYFVSDRTGWWNLYRWLDGQVVAIWPMAAEFGRPLWQFGARTWACAEPGRLVISYGERARWRLATFDVRTGTATPIATDLEPAESLAATSTHAVMIAGSPREAEAIVRIDLATSHVDTLRQSSTVAIPHDVISVPEAIEVATDAGQTVHAFFYRPVNPGFRAPAGARPPLLVISHGGPTATAYGRLSLEIQYWTSRGFAVVDVNYGGSAGFGRRYRERLNGQWGIVDVADCVSTARFLVERGDADAGRLVIRGRSAGGYTTLAALTFRPEVFRAGASYYGVADLERLAADTHKFESRYLDRLIGPYPAARTVYQARSPIRFADRMSSPVIFFQGLDDRVVPPAQSQMMADALRSKGLPVALLMFAGEQHGFRQAANISRCLEAELFFYGAVLGFIPAGVRPEFDIENLPS